MSKMSAFSTLLRGAATAALITALGILNTGCGGSSSVTVDEGSGGSPPRVISVSAADSTADESGETGKFEIRLAEITPDDLTVTFTLSGTATLNDDYMASHSTSIVIPGGSNGLHVTITPSTDSLIEGTETVTLTVNVPEGYVAGYSISADVTIEDVLDLVPDISVTATDAYLTESGDTGEFTVQLSQEIVADLELTIEFGGSATIDADYSVINADSVIIRAGSDRATIVVSPVFDGVTEGDETVSLSVTVPDGYEAGTNTSATVEILDVVPTISVSAAPTAILEGAGEAQFTVELSHNTPVALDVMFTLSGTAELETDYIADSTTMATIAADTKSAVVTITPKEDVLAEVIELVTLELEVPANYQVGDSQSASIEIENMPQDIEITDLDMTLKAIPHGMFMMGSPASDPLKYFYEHSQHQVTITRNFWMCSTETTVEQFQIFLKTAEPAASPAAAEADFSPADTGVVTAAAIADTEEGVNFDAAHCPLNRSYNLKLLNSYAKAKKPMVGITRVAAANFCSWLTERETVGGTVPAGYEFRLPTEAEWEYCCRANTTTIFHYGDDEPLDLEGEAYRDLGTKAWYYENCGARGKVTQVVGPSGSADPLDPSDLANPWGLYNMHGNVSEFCYDVMEEYLFPQIDPVGVVNDYGGYALRGGSFRSVGWMCRSANRYPVAVDEEDDYMGFRVVLAPIID